MITSQLQLLFALVCDVSAVLDPARVPVDDTLVRVWCVANDQQPPEPVANDVASVRFDGCVHMCQA